MPFGGRRPWTISRFETQWLAAPVNLSALSDLSGQWIARFNGSLNLNDFISAMQTMEPEYQLFLIDACRLIRA